jgi:hypothetical protein
MKDTRADYMAGRRAASTRVGAQTLDPAGFCAPGLLIRGVAAG